MNIEINTPNHQVKEWIISYVTNQIMNLQHRHKNISKAEVYFKDLENGNGEEKLCRIDLNIYKDSLFVQRKAGSYEQAMREVLNTLNEKVDDQIRLQKTK